MDVYNGTKQLQDWMPSLTSDPDHKIDIINYQTCQHWLPCFKYRPSRPRYRPIPPFLLVADTVWENRSPYLLQQKMADI